MFSNKNGKGLAPRPKDLFQSKPHWGHGFLGGFDMGEVIFVQFVAASKA